MSVAALFSSSSLYQFLQPLGPAGQTGGAGGAGQVSGGTDTDGDHDGSGGSGTGTVGQGRHGHHGMMKQLEAAITSALGSSGGTTDPNQVIQDTLKNFFNAGNTGQNGNTGNGQTSGTTTTNGSTTQDAFGQLLNSYGVSSQQFQQDLQAALQGSANGGIDFAKLFRNFPPGSAVDTKA